ncbi:MAG TPA: rRNA methyltransferase [Rhodospirillaceae bacterium]|nr:rRNA methyltransferase [Rhodospirillaceae bacterium]|tara:strand:+ start:19700 stop:20422 length:723 start_codon:yes stop_codon:yes gene_type:complete
MYNITFILTNPQMGENIGAAARAMANFGLKELRLVAPRDGWPSESAQAMSSGAFTHMHDVQVFPTLADALHDITFAYATTARPRDMVKDVFTPRQAARQTLSRTDTGKTAFVFGGERAGLGNDDVARCNAIITAPTNPDFSSLNLGQGVLMVAYELFMTAQEENIPPAEGTQHTPAPIKNFDNLFGRLEEKLDEGGFFRDEGLRPKITRNLRNTLMRAQLTEQEINTFHGVIRALSAPRS